MFLGGIECAQAEALNGGEDVVGGLCPTEGPGIGVDDVDIGEDGVFELSGGAMGAASQLLIGKQGEEALDLIPPGGAGRREVDVPAGMTGEPGADRRGALRVTMVIFASVAIRNVLRTHASLYTNPVLALFVLGDANASGNCC